MAQRITVVVNGTPHDVEVLARGRRSVRFKVSGREYAAEFQSSVSAGSGPPAPAAGTKTAAAPSSRSANADEVVAPMPGVVAAIHVAVGDTFQAGDVLVTVEAMKMQNKIFALRKGKVRRIAAAVGNEVSDGQLLIELDPQKRK